LVVIRTFPPNDGVMNNVDIIEHPFHPLHEQGAGAIRVDVLHRRNEAAGPERLGQALAVCWTIWSSRLSRVISSNAGTRFRAQDDPERGGGKSVGISTATGATPMPRNASRRCIVEALDGRSWSKAALR
jgi:hypothetical protein